jgi:hypothetical protein
LNIRQFTSFKPIDVKIRELTSKKLILAAMHTVFGVFQLLGQAAINI